MLAGVRRVKNVLWIIFSIAIAVLGYTLHERLGLNRGTLTVEIEESQERTVVMTWMGSIEHPMAAKIAEAYNTHAAGADRFVLSLHSPGGSLEHGNRVIANVERIKRSHPFDTAVEGWRQCASMCVPIYLKGDTRYASPGSQWLFHQVSLHDAISGEEKELRPVEKRVMTDRFFQRYFRPVGVPEQWIRSVARGTEQGDVWKSGRELVAEGAGIVTQLQ